MFLLGSVIRISLAVRQLPFIDVANVGEVLGAFSVSSSSIAVCTVTADIPPDATFVICEAVQSPFVATTFPGLPKTEVTASVASSFVQFQAYVVAEALSTVATNLSSTLNTTESTVQPTETVQNRQACAVHPQGKVQAEASQLPL